MINKKQIYIKSLSKKIFWIQFIFSIIFFGAISGVLYYFAGFAYNMISGVNVSKIYPPEYQNFLSLLLNFKDPFYIFILPVTAGSVFIFTFITWLILRSSAKKTISLIPASRDAAPDTNDTKKDPELEKRKFLHILSVLQEDGRFLDFLSEDLSDYDDQDIGAAVRSIHKGCNDGLKKYVELKPLLEEEEESLIEVPKNFNPDKYKLTGKVVGNPPFKGTIRHRGWRASNINMPELKKTDNAELLVPAEVEVE
ncbi:MAG: DUF2760 domain-containing protein [Thermodesulfobacteriota bacterium]